MNVRGERIIIFGDSLSHHGSDAAPEIWDANVGSARQSSTPGDLLASLLLEQGAAAVRVNARVGRSAWNFWTRENTTALLGSDQAFRPTKVLVMLGTNDADSGVAADKDRAAFTEIRDTYQAMGAEVYAIGPFLSAIPAAKVDQVVQVMRSVFGMRFIDGRPLSELAMHSGDGVHYTIVGARTLALALADAVLSKTPPATIWNTVGLGLLGIGAVFLGAMVWKRRQSMLGEAFVSGSDAMLGEPVDIVNGKRHHGSTNELIRKGFVQIPCSSKLDESGLARCWGKKPIDVRGIELSGIKMTKVDKLPTINLPGYIVAHGGVTYEIFKGYDKQWHATTEKHGTVGKAKTLKEISDAIERGPIEHDPSFVAHEREVPVRMTVLDHYDLDERGAVIRKKLPPLGELASPEDQRYRVAYPLVTRRDGKITTVADIVESNAGRPLTLAEAEKLRRMAAKRGYSGAWVETVDGEFVPVTGAKRDPKLPRKRAGEVHATMTSEPPKDKPRRADDYVKVDGELEGPASVKVGDRFERLGQTFEVIKVFRDKKRTVQLARRVADNFGKETFIDHRSLPIADFDRDYFKPISGLEGQKPRSKAAKAKAKAADEEAERQSARVNYGVDLDKVSAWEDVFRTTLAMNIDQGMDRDEARESAMYNADDTVELNASERSWVDDGAGRGSGPRNLGATVDDDEEPRPGEDNDTWWSRLQSKIAERRRPMRDALAKHDALIVRNGDRRVLLLKTPEVADVESGSIRVTEFDEDGPIGHKTRKTIDEIADELTSEWRPDTIEMASEEDVIAFTSTDRFAKGAAKVVEVQQWNARAKLEGTPKDIEAAVRAAQLYIGSDGTTSIRDQQRLYNTMKRKIAAVAKRHNIDEQSAYDQIIAQARSRGAITPTPGKDI